MSQYWHLDFNQALLEHKASVVVITRPNSAPKEYPAGVKSVAADLTSASSIAAVLKEHNVEVVICTVNPNGVQTQFVYADAAKLAGTVKLFVPSEFGVPTAGHTQGALGQKSKFGGEFIEKMHIGMLTEDFSAI